MVAMACGANELEVADGVYAAPLLFVAWCVLCLS